MTQGGRASAGVLAALVVLVAFGPLAAQAGEAAPFYNRVSNGADTYVLEALVDGRSAIAFYDYENGDSSSHTGYEESNTLSIFLWSGPEGKSLVFMVDKENDGSGGSLQVAIAGLPAGASWTVKDDPADTYTASGARWSWISCCTDGGVLGLATNDAIALNVTFPLVSGVSTFRLFGGPAGAPQFITFDRTKPLVIETFQTPGAPGLAGSAGPGAGELQVTATPPADDGGDPITLYRLYRTDGAAPVLAAESASGAFLLAGLGNGQTIPFVARAVNLGGEGDDSAPLALTTLDVPSAPLDLAVEQGPGVGELSLSWSASAEDGGAAVTSYLVERDGTFLAEVAATTFVDAGLANGATHAYTVAAVNLVGAGPASAPASGTTQDVPSAPLDLVVESGDALGGARLSWSPPAEDGGAPVATYLVYGGDAPDDLALLAEVTATSYEDVDEAALLPAARHYVVSAMNAVGEGPAADVVCGARAPYGPVAPLLCADEG